MKEIKSLEEIKKGIAIVDYWAVWCGPCKMMGPVFEETSKDYKNVAFVKCNVDDASELSQHESVMSIPTLVIYRDGKEVARTTGFKNKEQLKSWIDNNARN